MANKPILKIVKPGYDVNNTDLRNYLFHSDYTMFKLHSVSGGNITINAGSQSGYVDISHSLGYVPAFLVYVQIGTTWQLFPTGCRAYITSSGIRVTYEIAEFNTIYCYGNDSYSNNGQFYNIMGNEGGNGRDTAMRFINVGSSNGVALNSNDTLVSAEISWYIERVGSSTSDCKIRYWGINEDDCGSIFENLGRSKTSAESTQNISARTPGEYFGINVLSQAQEIVNRAGWSNNNHMGFYLFNNGSDNDAYRLTEDNTETETYLKIVKSGSITYPVKVVIFKDKIA